MNQNTKLIIELSDGQRSSTNIANIVGLSPRYVRKVMKKMNLPRLHEGSQSGSLNHQFQSGRRVGLDGYVIVTAPNNHPTARKRHGRDSLVIPEHRLVMEKSMGRLLHENEVVDHIDGLTLHNHQDNLRTFPSNAEHLRQTRQGLPPILSREGSLNTGIRTDLGKDCQPVRNYLLRRKHGEIRLRQILLAALILGIDSPYLYGTTHWLTNRQIDLLSRPSLIRALKNLYSSWGYSHAQCISMCPQIYNPQAP